VSLLYLDGSQPLGSCDIHKDKSQEAATLLQKLLGVDTLPVPGTGTESEGAQNSLNLDTNLTIDLP
jgi:hypothetical protein